MDGDNIRLNDWVSKICACKIWSLSKTFIAFCLERLNKQWSSKTELISTWINLIRMETVPRHDLRCDQLPVFQSLTARWLGSKFIIFCWAIRDSYFGIIWRTSLLNSNLGFVFLFFCFWWFPLCNLRLKNDCKSNLEHSDLRISIKYLWLTKCT